MCSLCGTIQVGLQTQLADRDEPSYANAVTLALSTQRDDARVIPVLAQRGLSQIYRPGNPFSKYSILLIDLSRRGELAPDLFVLAPRRGAGNLWRLSTRSTSEKVGAQYALAGCLRHWPGLCGGRC